MSEHTDASPANSNDPGRTASSGATRGASRRAFLAATALGAAAIATGSRANADVVAAPPKTPAPKGKPVRRVADDAPIRLGVIGTGGMGTGHCQAILSLVGQGREKAEIVAVADVNDKNAARARDICRRAQGDLDVGAYRDCADLIGREDIDAVIIATPEHWHARNAIDAILAGKDVYVEKPMTLDLPDALALWQVAQANPDVILQVGTQMTQLPKYAAARRLIKEGAIGKPVWSQTSYCRNSKQGEWLYYGIDPEWKPGVNLDWNRWCGPLGEQPWDPEVYARWRRYRKWSTGIIGDLLVHVLTPLMYAVDAGWPTRVTASGGHYVDKKMENHDQINITIEFENDHTMIVAGSTCNEVGLETLIRGHRANLYLGGRHCQLRPERIYVDEGVEEMRVECEDIGNDQDVHRLAFLRSVRTRERPMSDVEQGAKVMVVVDLASRSIWDGGAYAFDPATMTARRL
ncbi:MAG TPA: Gfo/Idh/MocA family oxidoreductase [Phycisphaerales bacterium]|nr:Gfo/Idh/MocA family oxidoreductase [Phycisphaerales bacterium]HMP35909.1 Gfo/Idh/MocA family oxidoreductase [Phycisphaerales bacterium]